MNAVLKKMSTSDKLRAMEQLWSDLTSDEDSYTSPSWHFEELKNTERALRNGKAKFLDWSAAKDLIRRRAK